MADMQRSNAGSLWKSSVERNGLGKEQMEGHLQSLSQKLEEEHGKLDLTDAEASHSVRKGAKKVRYVAGTLKKVEGEQQEIEKRMEGIQDRLGALCDARVGQRLLMELSKKLPLLSEVARWQMDSLAAIEKEKEREILEKEGTR